MDAGDGDGQTIRVIPRDATLTPSVNGLDADAECSSEVASGWFGVGAVLDRDSGRADEVLQR